MRYSTDGWGVGELWLDAGRVVLHELPRPASAAVDTRSPNLPQGTPGLPETSVPERDATVRDDFGTDLIGRLRRFFAGEAVTFDDVRIELEGCTPFQHALAEVLRNVPRGEVVTYGELAALAGRPGAARAAGTFCAQNRFAVFVPCHRVVAAGGIGGYGELGVEYKRRLLALEDVAL